jgi:hypothetical protein
MGKALSPDETVHQRFEASPDLQVPLSAYPASSSSNTFIKSILVFIQALSAMKNERAESIYLQFRINIILQYTFLGIGTTYLCIFAHVFFDRPFPEKTQGTLGFLDAQLPKVRNLFKNNNTMSATNV